MDGDATGGQTMKTILKHLIKTSLMLGLSTMTIARAADTPGATSDPLFINEGANKTTVTAPKAVAVGDGEATLMMNFRNAPLNDVLNYLSDAAGYTIILNTTVRGTIDAWNNQPVTKKEALDILNAALTKNGYAAVANGRKLTVISARDATGYNIPIKPGFVPEEIPNNDEM